MLRLTLNSFSLGIFFVFLGGAAVAQQPAARASGGVRADYWKTARRSGGEQRYLWYGDMIATTFDFSAEQKTRILQFANASGLGPCIEETDSYVNRGVEPPGLSASSPVTQCAWNMQTFMEWVFSLVTAEQKATHAVRYTNISREIAGNRTALELRSRR